MRYIVTNVRLEASMFRSLKLAALERGVPASVLIREALREFLTAAKGPGPDWDRSWKDLKRFVGAARSRGDGPSTGSTDVDEALYGPRRRKGP